MRGALSALLIAGALLLSGCVTEVPGQGTAAPGVKPEPTEAPGQAVSTADAICHMLSMTSLGSLAGRRLTQCSPIESTAEFYDEDGYLVADVTFIDYAPDVDFARSEMRAAAPGKQKVAGFGDEPALWDPKFLVFEARYAAALAEVKVKVPMDPARALRFCQEGVHELGG